MYRWGVDWGRVGAGLSSHSTLKVIRFSPHAVTGRLSVHSSPAEACSIYLSLFLEKKGGLYCVQTNEGNNSPRLTQIGIGKVIRFPFFSSVQKSIRVEFCKHTKRPRCDGYWMFLNCPAKHNSALLKASFTQYKLAADEHSSTAKTTRRIDYLIATFLKNSRFFFRFSHVTSA